MEIGPVAIIGIGCVIGAVIGGGLKLANVLEIPLLESPRRQFLLGIVGLILILAGSKYPNLKDFQPRDAQDETTAPEAPPSERTKQATDSAAADRSTNQSAATASPEAQPAKDVGPDGADAISVSNNGEPSCPSSWKKEFIIYFPSDQAVLTPEATFVLGEAAKVFDEGSGLAIDGHDDTLKTRRESMMLSINRAKTVRSAMKKFGFDYARVRALGELTPAVNTGDAVAEPFNRRVTLIGCADPLRK